jgi:hypothetical protein
LGADLLGADLSGADLSRANLSRADLLGADLLGADLSGAKQRILTIQGSRDQIVALDDDVKIGCFRHPLGWWLDNYATVGAENKYTPAQIAEYAEHLRHIERVLAIPQREGVPQ